MQRKNNYKTFRIAPFRFCKEKEFTREDGTQALHRIFKDGTEKEVPILQQTLERLGLVQLEDTGEIIPYPKDELGRAMPKWLADIEIEKIVESRKERKNQQNRKQVSRSSVPWLKVKID